MQVRGAIKHSTLHREFVRISYLSKLSGYSTRQYLSLVAQLIAGTVSKSKVNKIN